jgi:hypothetical protein
MRIEDWSHVQIITRNILTEQEAGVRSSIGCMQSLYGPVT